MKKIILILVTASALAGCNTVAGVGQDITGAAHSVQSGMPGGGGY